MNLKIGDRVKFLNDVGEGSVTAIVDKKTVMVSTPDGFDMPVLENDLILIAPAEPKIVEESPANKEIETFDKIEDEGEEPVGDDEIVLGLRMKNNSDISAYLINISSYHLYFTVSQKKEGENLFLSGGELEPETQVVLPKIVPVTIDEPVVLYVQLIFFNKSFYSPVAPLNRKIEFSPSDLYSGLILKDNEYFENKAAIFPVYSFRNTEESFGNKKVEGDLKKILEEKKGNSEKSLKKPKPKKNEPVEVDLHIQHIVDDYKDLSNGEIVDIQMSRFKTSLETAIIHKTRRIVFIHGVGNGKLKYELRKKLDKDYPGLKYQDASFSEYGYGATMVIIPA